MPIRTSMNVSLTPELERFVQSRVASGLFQTASEVVREGLRLLEEREQAREAALAEIRARIGRGVEQADRGELLDGDAVFEEIRQLSARRRADGKGTGRSLSLRPKRGQTSSKSGTTSPKTASTARTR
ncbi:MAG: type II toxin-antitoxin system ParD family antitoxin [Bryobacteraceae bacterium]